MKQQLHHRQVSARFSAAARTYTAVSGLQDKVARRVLDLIPDTYDAGDVLDAGCGPGRLAMMVRQRWPHSMITGVDIALGMVEEASHRFAGEPRARFITGDMATFDDGRQFDLVVSSSAMHWLKPFSSGLAHLACLTRSGGMCAIGLMLDGTMGEVRLARDAVAPHKSPAGRLPTMTELEEAARGIEGVRIRRLEQTTAEYDQPSAADVLSTIHDMGVTGGDVSRGTAPLTRKEMRALENFYEQHFATGQGVRVTFVVGYLLLERV